MTPEERESVLRRRNAALQRLDEGHQVLLKSLEGMDTEEAFLGQRWSVRDVLLHLDSERYVDALEKIARGDMEMLPPFTSREEHFRQELEQQEATHQRFRALLTELTPEQLARPATPANPANSFPGLTLLELLERSAGHEASHARQIDLTRQFVAAFRSQDRALNIAALGDGDPSRLSPQVKDLLNMADYVVGRARSPGCRRPHRAWRPAYHPLRQPRGVGQPRRQGGPRWAVGRRLCHGRRRRRRRNRRPGPPSRRNGGGAPGGVIAPAHVRGNGDCHHFPVSLT